MNMLNSSEMQQIASQLASSMGSDVPSATFQTSFSSDSNNGFTAAATTFARAAEGSRPMTASAENGSQNISEYDESDLTEAERQDWESIIVEDEAFQENMPEQPVPSEAYLAGNRTRN